jgi:ATP-dependent exoDNAse (exonuclease V) beta subunit
MRPHISFSELKKWDECPYKHKLVYIDEIKKFIGNEHTAFGKAIHDVCEKLLLSGKTFDAKNLFSVRFLEELKILEKSGLELRSDLVRDMRKQGEPLTEHILPSVKSFFKDYEVVSAEEELREELEDGLKYKGYIDLVLKTKDGKYHIIDWKTCSWGWDSRRKSDKMTTYQLTFYKHFFSLKHNIDPKNIETYFALLKRTAKKNNAEIFKVSTGAKKTQNAINLLNKAIYNIKNKRYIKNRLSCHTPFGPCEFLNTEFCK